MAALKPIQPSVCNDIKIWKQICNTVNKPITSEQIEKAKKRSEQFKKVCESDKSSK